MSKIKVAREKCKGCYLCIAHCPQGLLVVEERLNKLGVKPVQFKEDTEKKCIGCSFCYIMCPEVAIEVIKE